MRANEFITEDLVGKPLEAHTAVSPGVVFTMDGGVDLYRAALLMAGLPNQADNIDPYSFVTNKPFIVTYTEEERKMVKDAFTKLKIPFKEIAPQGSKEPEQINTVSPFKSFGGY